MELYILLAIIWGVGVIWCAMYRMLLVLHLQDRVTYDVSSTQVCKSLTIDFLWFIYIPWIALKWLFKDV